MTRAARVISATCEAVSEIHCPRPCRTIANRADFPRLRSAGSRIGQPPVAGSAPAGPVEAGPERETEPEVKAPRAAEVEPESVTPGSDDSRPGGDPKRAQPGRKALRVCAHCGAALRGRGHRRTCSPRCRVALHRSTKRGGAA